MILAGDLDAVPAIASIACTAAAVCLVAHLAGFGHQRVMHGEGVVGILGMGAGGFNNLPSWKPVTNKSLPMRSGTSISAMNVVAGKSAVRGVT